jgi:hypothetical protein
VARRKAGVARAFVVPVGFLRSGDEGRVTGVLQFLGEAVGDLVHFPQHQHVDVLHRHVGLAAERAGWNALHQHDHALAVRRDTLGRLRPARIGRERVQGRGTGDANQIGAQIFGATFDEGRVHFSHLDESTCTRPRRTLSSPLKDSF